MRIIIDWPNYADKPTAVRFVHTRTHVDADHLLQLYRAGLSVREMQAEIKCSRRTLIEAIIRYVPTAERRFKGNRRHD